jgi:hypothetical protein
MKPRALQVVTFLFAGLCGLKVDAGQIYGITYSDIATDSTVNLTTAGSLDWVKWGNGESGNVAYTTPVMSGSSIINPSLTPRQDDRDRGPGVSRLAWLLGGNQVETAHPSRLHWNARPGDAGRVSRDRNAPYA